MSETIENENSVFIDGKNQIIEMLQIMPENEKKILLDNIRKRNPQLAIELMKRSITFESIQNFSKEKFIHTSKYIKAQILGVALKESSVELQKNILSKLERDYAEKTFYFMNEPIQNEKNASIKAQSKIIDIISSLSNQETI